MMTKIILSSVLLIYVLACKSKYELKNTVESSEKVSQPLVDSFNRDSLIKLLVPEKLDEVNEAYEMFDTYSNSLINNTSILAKLYANKEFKYTKFPNTDFRISKFVHNCCLLIRLGDTEVESFLLNFEEEILDYLINNSEMYKTIQSGDKKQNRTLGNDFTPRFALSNLSYPPSKRKLLLFIKAIKLAPNLSYYDGHWVINNGRHDLLCRFMTSFSFESKIGFYCGSNKRGIVEKWKNSGLSDLQAHEKFVDEIMKRVLKKYFDGDFELDSREEWKKGRNREYFRNY